MLAVELSSFQLHWAPSVRPEAGVVLNIAEDHLDWHGTMDDYAAAKAGVLRGRVAVAGLDDPRAAELLAAAPAPVRVGFRLGDPAAGELGVRDGMLVDRAFFAPAPTGWHWRRSSSIPVPGPVGVLDALAAAALARSIGVPAEAIATALASFQVGRHRAEVVAVVDQISYVDDSKATNPHAAEASRAGLPAGGVDRRRSAQGRIGARDRGQGRSAAGRSGVDRPGPGDGCRGVIATRTGCARRTGCGRRGY